MISEFPADLHIHTCLSPCAGDEMIPTNILNMAKLLGTKILGICDHNSAGNVEAMLKAAQLYDILIIPGMEVQSVEEVHMLCFFKSLEEVKEWQSYVYSHLPPIKNNSRYFGNQWVVDKLGNILCEEDRMLITSTSLTVEQISEKVSNLDGLLIPAHVDKRHYSLISQLGFIPEGIKICAIEYSRNISKDDFIEKFSLDNYNLITSSDAHSLKDMVYQKTFICVKSLNINEVMMALKGSEGRRVITKG